MKSLLITLLAALSLSVVMNLPVRAEEAAAFSTPVPAPSIPPNVDPATATRMWLDTVPAEKRARSDAYFEGKYWLILWEFVTAAVISIFLLVSGISARIRDWAEKLTRFKTMQVVFYVIPFLLLTGLLAFPLTAYEDFFREHQYGLATQTFGPWFGDQLKALGFSVVGLSIFLPVVYWVFRKSPRNWPIWAATVVFVFQLFVMFIFPVFVAPAFNNYTPLEDPAIRDPIVALARANQIPTDQVYEVDASRQTTRISANVAGFLGTTRIALNDNLLKQCSLPEIREVMGHEMGHFVLNHGLKLSIYLGLLFLIGAFVIRFAFEKAVGRWGNSWGVRGIADPAGLPLLSLFLAAYFFLITPVTNTVIRVTEAEADIFGLNTSREPDGFAMVSLKLGTYRKLDPAPLEEFIFFDHPSGRARIRMAMDWKAANLPAGETGP